MENKANDKKPDDDRSAYAIGYAWATRITAIGIEMALPILLGVWLDRKFGTLIVFVLLGMGLGMGIGYLHLLKIVREGTGS